VNTLVNELQNLQTRNGDKSQTVQRITGMSTPPEGLLLDALADQVQLGSGQRHDVERVMPISA